MPEARRTVPGRSIDCTQGYDSTSVQSRVPGYPSDRRPARQKEMLPQYDGRIIWPGWRAVRVGAVARYERAQLRDARMHAQHWECTRDAAKVVASDTGQYLSRYLSKSSVPLQSCRKCLSFICKALCPDAGARTGGEVPYRTGAEGRVDGSATALVRSCRESTSLVASREARGVY